MYIGIVKKIRYKIGIVILFVLLCSSLSISSIYAQIFGNTPVVYSKEESDVYTISVTVDGAGELQSKMGIIRNQTRNYILNIDESIVFQIKPDKNSEIKSVILNGQDVKSEVKNDRIVVNGLKGKQKLNVEFSTKANVNEDTAKTNDAFKVGGYVILLIISLGTITYLLFTKKRKSDNSSIDREDVDDAEE